MGQNMPIRHDGKLYNFRVNSTNYSEPNGYKIWELEVFEVNDGGEIIGKPVNCLASSKGSDNLYAYVEMNIQDIADRIGHENK